jgi:hypothetical protein
MLSVRVTAKPALHDREIALALARGFGDLHAGSRVLSALERPTNQLRAGLDEDNAADVVWGFNDPVQFYMLVRGRGWSEEKFQVWLMRAFEAELLSR